MLQQALHDPSAVFTIICGAFALAAIPYGLMTSPRAVTMENDSDDSPHLVDILEGRGLPQV